MLLAIAWLDHVVIVGYLAATLLVGFVISRRQRSDEEYFLAGRSMPWFVVGLSLLATLTSSLQYLSAPGEVWKSGINYVLGKLMAMPLEAVVAFFVLIPFLMRFRFTSAYEYLGYRFGRPARRLGEALFICLAIGWMGFVVLATSRALETVTGIDLALVIATVGVGATAYTVMGGFRAVLWTEVAQVALMVGGALLCIGYVSITTGTWLPQWYRASIDFQTASQGRPVPFFSLDPTERTTVITFMINMAVWYLLTHAGNQMAVQRYFANKSLKKAWASFLTAACVGVLLKVLLASTGLALLYSYTSDPSWLPPDYNPRGGGSKGPDAIFPMFMKQVLPPGMAGAVLAAVLSAAMSTIDSGVNAVATVLTVATGAQVDRRGGSHVGAARWMSLAAGLCITAIAYALNPLTRTDNIVAMMQRTFNIFVAPMGGLFLVGIFLPHVGGRAAVLASLSGLLASLSLAYSKHLIGVEFSFTLIIPGSLLVVLLAAVFGIFDRPLPAQIAGLTWWSRRESPKIDPNLLAPSLQRNDSP